MDFELAVEQRAGFTIIKVSGELDIYVAQYLDACVSETLAGETTALAVDLTGCSFLDSEGIKVLVRAYHAVGGRLIVLGAHGNVLKTLRISGLDTLFQIVLSPDDLSAHGENL